MGAFLKTPGSPLLMGQARGGGGPAAQGLAPATAPSPGLETARLPFRPQGLQPSWKGEAGGGCWTGSPGSAPTGEAGSEAPTRLQSCGHALLQFCVLFQVCREPSQRGGPRGRRGDGPWQEVAPPPLCPNPAGGGLAGPPSALRSPSQACSTSGAQGGTSSSLPTRDLGQGLRGFLGTGSHPHRTCASLGKIVAQLGPVSGKSESLSQVRLVDCVEPGGTPSPPGWLTPTSPRVQS